MTLEQACKKLIIKEPFWGIFLLGLNKSYSDKVPTLGVRRLNIGVELIVNKTFWDSLKDESQLAVLLHELHHISLNHLILKIIKDLILLLMLKLIVIFQIYQKEPFMLKI